MNAIKLLTFTIISPFLISSCTTSIKETESITQQTNAKQPSLQKARFGKELIEAFIPFTSSAVKSNDKLNFSYELNIANNYKLPMELVKVELFDTEDTEKPFLSFGSDYITSNLQRPGLIKQNKKLFKGNQFGILNLWLSLNPTQTPKLFFHKLHFNIDTGKGSPVSLSVEKALTAFPEETELTLAPPFREGYWFYYTIGHKNTRELTEGRASYAQRFAIDWVAINQDGTFVNGNRNKNESFFTYGKEILAVADGVIVDIQDNIPENLGETDERAIKLNRYNQSGNHIMLDIGNGVNVVYAHFIPNSLKYKIGDKVKTGDVLGLLGNSGESTGPHLHMHLETKNKMPSGGEGLPYKFNSFTEVSAFPDDVDLEQLFSTSKLPIHELNRIKYNEIPIGIGILKF